MNKGDTIEIVLAYTVDGEPLAQGDFDEIEFSIGTKRYTLTHEDITWDSDLGAYTLSIGQADSFALGGQASYQVRFKKGSKVVSSNIQHLVLGGTISKKVI